MLRVALPAVRLWQGLRLVVLSAGDDRLHDGFHDYKSELHLRWTDGEARPPTTVFHHLTGACEVEIILSGKTCIRCLGSASRLAMA
jgi:hypothetical protein